MKPYTVASARIIGAFNEDEIRVATPKRPTTHTTIEAARRVAKETAGGDISNAPKYLMLVKGPGVEEYWYRYCRESIRGRDLITRATGVRYSGRVINETCD